MRRAGQLAIAVTLVASIAAMVMVTAAPMGPPARGARLVRDDGAVSGRVLFRATTEMTTVTVAFDDPEMPNTPLYCKVDVEVVPFPGPIGTEVFWLPFFGTTDAEGRVTLTSQYPLDFSYGLPYRIQVTIDSLWTKDVSHCYTTDAVQIYARQ